MGFLLSFSHFLHKEHKALLVKFQVVLLINSNSAKYSTSTTSNLIDQLKLR